VNGHTERAYRRWYGLYVERWGELVTAENVQAWLDGLVEQGYGTASVAQARAAVTWYGKAQRRSGRITRDEFLAVKLEVESPAGKREVSERGRKGNRARVWLGVEELRQVMWAIVATGGTEAAKARNRVLALMLGTLGLREAECVAARWEDVEERRGANGERRVRLRVRGKGGTFDVVDVPEVLAGALEEWKALVPASSRSGAILRRVWRSGKVDARGMGTSAVYRIVAIAGARCGVKIGPHDLRATVAGLLADRGVAVEDISRLLRHRNQEVTRRYIGRRGAGASGVMEAVLADAGGGGERRDGSRASGKGGCKG